MTFREMKPWQIRVIMQLTLAMTHLKMKYMAGMADKHVTTSDKHCSGSGSDKHYSGSGSVAVTHAINTT